MLALHSPQIHTKLHLYCWLSATTHIYQCVHFYVVYFYNSAWACESPQFSTILYLSSLSSSLSFTFCFQILWMGNDKQTQQIIGGTVTHLLPDALLIPGSHRCEKVKVSAGVAYTHTHWHKYTKAAHILFTFNHICLSPNYFDVWVRQIVINLCHRSSKRFLLI